MPTAGAGASESVGQKRPESARRHGRRAADQLLASELREDVVDLPGVGALLAQRAVGNAFAKAVAQVAEGRIVLSACHLAQHLPLGIRTAKPRLRIPPPGHKPPPP